MKQYRLYLAIAILVLASLACLALSGVRDTPPTLPPVEDNTNPPAVEPTGSNDNGSNDSVVSTDFPMTGDAYDVIELGDGSILYYTKMSLEDVMKFYRDEYASRGYEEREPLTVVASGTFSMVFDGDPSGKAVVIQSVDFGDGSCSVAIRLEDV